jgi:hypothetical protein
LRSDGKIMSLRGYKPGAGTIHAGRVDVDAEVRGEAVMAINADYVRGAMSGLKTDGVMIRGAGEAIKIEPRHISGAVAVEAIIFIIRASEAELADV